MTHASSELILPASRGARVVAMAMLAEATQASARLTGAARDVEALHDFRVAVRRLRSWVRAFDDELRDVRKRDRKRLRRIAKATNPGRDIEVQIEWLRDAAHGRGTLRQQGASWVIAILERRHAAAELDLGDLVTNQFTKLRDDLERVLDPASTAVEERNTTSLAAAIAARMTTAASELRGKLDVVQAITDDVASHEARIAAKQLRYLIEPAAAHVDGGTELLKQLKKLQDDLGEMHDRHVMAAELCALAERSAALGARTTIAAELGAFGARVAASAFSSELDAQAADEARDVDTAAPPRSLAALARRLRRDLEQQFARTHGRWLDGRHHQLDVQITEFAERLRSDFAG